MAIESMQVEYSRIKRIELERYPSGRVTIWLWGDGTLESVRVFNGSTGIDIQVNSEAPEVRSGHTNFPPPHSEGEED